MTPALAPRPTPTPAPAPPRAVRAPAPPVRPMSGGPAVRLGLAPAVAAVVRSPGPGSPLAAGVRATLEASFGMNLAAVRVHTTPAAAAAAAGLGARAFAAGSHVFLGRGQQPTDLPLMAHEVAHVLQQQPAGPAVRLFGPGRPGDRFEAEAHAASAAVARGDRFAVGGRTGGLTIQKDADPKAEEAGFLERQAWDMLQSAAPDLVPLFRMGLLDWLKEQITTAVRGLVDTLTAPVKAVQGVAGDVSRHFGELVMWMRDAAARIARNDCGPITEAAEKIQSVFEGLAAPVIEKVKQIAGKVSAFFTGLWDRFGAPAWDFLKRVGGAAWEVIEKLARRVWEKTAPIRNLLSAAWTWIKNKLGIGEGPEGQDGLLQWVQKKAGEAFDYVKKAIEPIKKPLMVVGGVLVMLSPAGPLIALGAGVYGLMKGVQWVRQNLRSRTGVVGQRDFVKGTILPAVLGAVDGVTAALRSAAAWLTTTLNKVTAGFGDAVGALGGSAVAFLESAVRWVAGQFTALATWATDQVSALADLVRDGLDKLRRFAQPLLDVLTKLGDVIGDLWQVGKLVVGRVWNWIPACIRDPIVDFLKNQILRRIPIFKQLIETPGLWEKVQRLVTTAFRQVFRDGDLVGAAVTVFWGLLDVLGVPQALVVGIRDKAVAAMDQILNDPIGFLKNAVRAMKEGFAQFFRNVDKHLLGGLGAWLFGAAQKSGVSPPRDFSVGSIFRFALDLLGINLERVLGRLEKKTSKRVAQAVRTTISVLTGVWEWAAVAIREGPAGLWRMAMEKLKDLWKVVLDTAVGWVVTRVTVAAGKKIALWLNPSGVTQVIDALVSIYNAVESFAAKLREILEVIDSVLDGLGEIARGVVTRAAGLLESSLGRAIPVALEFLANQVGLGDIATKVKEIVEKVREKIDEAIDWLIDRALAGGRAVLSFLQGGGPAPAAGPADAPAAAAVKGRALAEVNRRLRERRLGSLDQLHDVLASVRDQFRPQGLRALTARVTDEGDLRFQVVATASPEEAFVLRLGEVVNPGQFTPEELENFRLLFATQGYETYAALVANGTVRHTVSNASEHAEVHLLTSPAWAAVVDEAAARARAREVTVVTVLINRCPCQACTRRLIQDLPAAAARIRAAAADPQYVRFVLAPTGIYEPTVTVPDAEVAAAAAAFAQQTGAVGKAAVQPTGTRRAFDRTSITRMSDLTDLESHGWDLRALLARERATSFGTILADALVKVKHKVAEQLNAKGQA